MSSSMTAIAVEPRPERGAPPATENCGSWPESLAEMAELLCRKWDQWRYAVFRSAADPQAGDERLFREEGKRQLAMVGAALAEVCGNLLSARLAEIEVQLRARVADPNGAALPLRRGARLSQQLTPEQIAEARRRLGPPPERK